MKNNMRFFLIISGLMFALPALFFINLDWLELRFVSHFANKISPLILMLILLFLALINIYASAKIKLKYIAIPSIILNIIIAIFLAFESLAFKIFITLPENNENDGSFEQIYQTKKDIHIYRTNGGATTAYGIVVQQEKPFLPGIIHAKVLYSSYPEYDIKYAWRGDTLILSDPDNGHILKEILVK